LSAQQQLYNQQTFNEQQSMLSTLSRKLDAQQQDMSIAAQSVTNELELQRQLGTLALQEEQLALASQQQANAIQQGRTQAQLSESQQVAASAKRTADVSTQVGGAVAQATAQLTDADRQALVIAAARTARAGNNDVQQTRGEISRAISGLSSANDAQKALLETTLQNANEVELAQLSAQSAQLQLSGADRTNQLNTSLGGLALNTARSTASSNAANTTAALKSTEASNSILRGLTERSATDQIEMQRRNYEQQQNLTSTTSATSQQQMEQRKKDINGANLLDYLALGVSAGSAFIKPPKPSSSGLTGGASYIPPYRATDLGGSSYIPPG
jgi:hypothetical protein